MSWIIRGQASRHARQVHRRRDHGVLGRAGGGCAARAQRRAGGARDAEANAVLNALRRARLAGAADRRRVQLRHRARRRHGLAGAPRLYGDGRRGERRLAAGGTHQALWRRDPGRARPRAIASGRDIQEIDRIKVKGKDEARAPSTSRVGSEPCAEARRAAALARGAARLPRAQWDQADVSLRNLQRMNPGCALYDALQKVARPRNRRRLPAGTASPCLRREVGRGRCACACLGCSGGIGGRHLRTTSFLRRQRRADRRRHRRRRPDARRAVADRPHLHHPFAPRPRRLDPVPGRHRGRHALTPLDGLRDARHASRSCRTTCSTGRSGPDFTEIPTPRGAVHALPGDRARASRSRCGGRKITPIAGAPHGAGGGLPPRQRRRRAWCSPATPGRTTRSWKIVNRIANLKFLIIETAFSNKERQLAEVSRTCARRCSPRARLSSSATRDLHHAPQARRDRADHARRSRSARRTTGRACCRTSRYSSSESVTDQARPPAQPPPRNSLPLLAPARRRCPRERLPSSPKSRRWSAPRAAAIRSPQPEGARSARCSCCAGEVLLMSAGRRHAGGGRRHARTRAAAQPAPGAGRARTRDQRRRAARRGRRGAGHPGDLGPVAVGRGRDARLRVDAQRLLARQPAPRRVRAAAAGAHRRIC